MEFPQDPITETNLDELPPPPSIELRKLHVGRPLGLIKLGPLSYTIGIEQAQEFEESIAPRQDAHIARNRIFARQVLSRFMRG